jgi:hypothetical protein
VFIVDVLVLNREVLTGWAVKMNLLQVFRGEEVVKETPRVFYCGLKSFLVICQMESK